MRALISATHLSGEWYELGYEFVVVPITQELARRVLRRRKAHLAILAEEPELYGISFWDHTAYYLSGDALDELLDESTAEKIREAEYSWDEIELDQPALQDQAGRTECARMVLDRSGVTFKAIIKHTDICVESDYLEFDQFEPWLSLPSEPDTSPRMLIADDRLRQMTVTPAPPIPTEIESASKEPCMDCLGCGGTGLFGPIDRNGQLPPAGYYFFEACDSCRGDLVDDDAILRHFKSIGNVLENGNEPYTWTVAANPVTPEMIALCAQYDRDYPWAQRPQDVVRTLDAYIAYRDWWNKEHA